MALNFNQGALFLAEESTPGTLETFASGDGGFAISAIQPAPEIGRQEQNIITPNLGTLASVATTFAGGMTFTTQLKGGSALGVAPKAGAILRMAGFTETLNSGTSVEYDLGGTFARHSAAFDVNDDAGGNSFRFASAGCLANIVLSVGAVGEFLAMACTVRGTYEDASDVSPLSPTIETKIPPVFREGIFQVGGVSLKARSFSLDLGNNVILQPDIGSSSGFKLAKVVNRAPVITFEAELENVATHDFYGLVKANTENTLLIRSENITNNTITIEASKCKYNDPSLANADGAPVVTMQAQLNIGGTNEVKITLD